LRIIIQERNGTSSEGAPNSTNTSSEGAKNVTSATSSEGAKNVTPTTTKETQHKRVRFPTLPCITQEYDESDPTDTNDDDLTLPRYRLRSHVNIIANSVIIDEPPNVANFNPEGKLGQAPPPEHEKMCPLEPNQYVPPYLANAIVCPDTGKELEWVFPNCGRFLTFIPRVEDI
jgi:hypothetical protein